MMISVCQSMVLKPVENVRLKCRRRHHSGHNYENEKCVRQKVAHYTYHYAYYYTYHNEAKPGAANFGTGSQTSKLISRVIFFLRNNQEFYIFLLQKREEFVDRLP